MGIYETSEIWVDGLRIRLKRGLNATGLPLLLTSPWPESLFAFKRVWPILDREAAIVAIDLPGFGLSDHRADLMSPRAMGAFVLRILAELGLKRVHAVGPDVGTSALLFAAHADPERFESLIVGSGAMDAALTTGGLNHIIFASATQSIESVRGETFAAGAIDHMMKNKPDPEVMRDYLASSAGGRFGRASAYVRAYPDDLAALRVLLPEISTPVLSIWGAHDQIVPPSNADVLGYALPRTRSMLLDSGHFVWEDQPENYAAAVLDWIGGGYRAA